MGMGTGKNRNKTPSLKDLKKSDPKAYKAEVQRIKDATPGYQRFEQLGYAPSRRSSTQVVSANNKYARSIGKSVGMKGGTSTFTESRLKDDIKKYTAALDAKELLARQREEIKSKGQEAKGARMRAGVRNKQSRSLLAETERAGFLGPTGTLG